MISPATALVLAFGWHGCARWAARVCLLELHAAERSNIPALYYAMTLLFDCTVDVGSTCNTID